MVADHLSRLENLNLDALVEKKSFNEEFSDEYLFLASDIFPHGLSYQ